MKTVIIGSGNEAYHLAKAFTQNNIKIDQIFGRNEIELSNISGEFNIPYSTEKLEDDGSFFGKTLEKKSPTKEDLEEEIKTEL